MAKLKGTPKTGGRAKGVPNKIGREVRELAQKHTVAAINTLAEIMETGDTATARAMAANSLLDRAHGKPAQAIVGGSEDDNPLKQVIQVVTGVPRG